MDISMETFFSVARFKMGMAITQKKIRWIIGTGHHISVWFDTWVGDSPIIEFIGFTNYVKNNIQMKVKDLLQNGRWKIHVELQSYINYPLLIVSGAQDSVIWCGDIKGNFSTTSAVNGIIFKQPKLHWPVQIWKQFLHPGITSNIWKIRQGVFVDDQKRVTQGYSMVSMCCVCNQEQDSMEHLLWFCSFSLKIWQWLGNIFHFSIPSSFDNIFQLAKHYKSIVKEIWITDALSIIRELWFMKNIILFYNAKPNENSFKSRILNSDYHGGFRMKGTRWNQDYDTIILKFFHLDPRRTKFTTLKDCFWVNPAKGFVLFCCDGSAVGNPGLEGFGIIARDHECRVLGTISGGLGVATNYIAEALDVIWALEWAVKLHCDNIIIRSD
ncbi:uncharacterized protein LOC113332914 [Papaver somniferum]|uniref:uncharacterized protein LOC113332914 n=1 Tax=Papaver somniferum TaxID=3469 RepID=UPI000E701EC5|nr:uncharacterized protein LOC113332914 [Papaver somniferum]